MNDFFISENIVFQIEKMIIIIILFGYLYRIKYLFLPIFLEDLAHHVPKKIESRSGSYMNFMVKLDAESRAQGETKTLA